MGWHAWKTFESEAATFFGGLRRIRIMYNEKIGDVIHPFYSIECKYGGQVPAYLSPRHPTLLTVDSGCFWVIPSSYCEIIDGNVLKINTDSYLKNEKNTSVFLDKAMEQAKRYNPTLKPIVCVKPKFWKGFVVVLEVEEFQVEEFNE